jgi:hypothetical protein
MTAAVDLEELRQKKAFEELQAQKSGEPTEGTPVTTAFLIAQQENGQWVALADYSSVDLVPERVATMDDIVGGCEAVKLGCLSQQTAMTMAMMMNQQAAQMRAQMDSQRIASQLDLSKLHGGK